MSLEPPALKLQLFEESVLNYNRKAMHDLRNGAPDKALFLLNEALSSVLNSPNSALKSKFLAISYNNLGCVYKQQHKAKLAIHYYSKAIEHQHQPELLAGTHLNICTLLARQGQHEKSLRHALKAIQVLRRDFQVREEFIQTLVVAYHNAGIEYECLGLRSEALDVYLNGFFLGIERLGKNHPATEAVQKNLERVQEKLGFTKTKAKRRRVKSQVVESKRQYVYEVIKNRHREHSPETSKLSSRKALHKKRSPKPYQKVDVAKEYPSFSLEMTPIKAILPTRKLPQLHRPKLAKKNKAALKIQAWWRGRATRSKYAQAVTAIRLAGAKTHLKHAQMTVKELERSNPSGDNSCYRRSVYRYKLPPEELLGKIKTIQSWVRKVRSSQH